MFTCYVTMGSHLKTWGRHTKTIYLSIPVKIDVKPRKYTEAKAQIICEKAEKLLTESLSGLFFSRKGIMFHPHRSIDEMRMFHSWCQRTCLWESGSVGVNGDYQAIWV